MKPNVAKGTSLSWCGFLLPFYAVLLKLGYNYVWQNTVWWVSINVFDTHVINQDIEHFHHFVNQDFSTSALLAGRAPSLFVGSCPWIVG